MACVTDNPITTVASHVKSSSIANPVLVIAKKRTITIILIWTQPAVTSRITIV